MCCIVDLLEGISPVGGGGVDVLRMKVCADSGKVDNQLLKEP
jgi:hypothetical protein